MKTVTYDETQWKLVPIEPTLDMVFATTHINNTLEHEDLFPMLRDAIAAAPPYPEATFDDYPEFNSVAMGCGLEDAGHTDRYEAMRYGWYQAIEMLGGRIDNFLAAPKVEE